MCNQKRGAKNQRREQLSSGRVGLRAETATRERADQCQSWNKSFFLYLIEDVSRQVYGNVRRVPHAGALDAQRPALIRADTERSQALVSRVKKRKFGGAGACALQFALSAAQQSAASAGFLAAAAASVSEQQLLQ